MKLLPYLLSFYFIFQINIANSDAYEEDKDFISCHQCRWWRDATCQFMSLPPPLLFYDELEACVDTDWQEEEEGEYIEGIPIATGQNCYWIEVYNSVDAEAEDVICAVRGVWYEFLNIDEWKTIESEKYSFSLKTKVCDEDFCNEGSNNFANLKVLFMSISTVILAKAMLS